MEDLQRLWDKFKHLANTHTFGSLSVTLHFYVYAWNFIQLYSSRKLYGKSRSTRWNLWNGQEELKTETTKNSKWTENKQIYMSWESVRSLFPAHCRFSSFLRNLLLFFLCFSSYFLLLEIRFLHIVDCKFSIELCVSVSVRAFNVPRFVNSVLD